MNIRKISYLLAASLLIAGSGKAQEQPSLRQKADLLYSRYEYSRAAELYKQLASRKKPYLADLQKLADSYRRMNQYNDAAAWYSKVTADSKSSNADLLAFAEVLKASGKYNEAREQFENYAEKTGEEQNIALAGCDSALKWIASPTKHILQNEDAINTSLSEFAAIPVGNQVFYAAEPAKGAAYGWTGNGFLKLFNAEAGQSLSNASLAQGSFNNVNYHIGPVCFNKAATTMFATRTYAGKQGDLDNVGARKYYTKKLELIIFRKDDSGSWIETPFAYNNVKQYSVGHAALSTDERTLYFVSDMPGGQGGTDIWYSELQNDGTWGAPVNCGNVINTKQDELFPSIMADGSLYFSSLGFAGMGGLDLYRSTGSGAQWTMPVNLQYPLNSAGDDFGFYQQSNNNGTTGFLSSNRDGGKGGDDIYAFRYVAPPKFILALQAITLSKKDNSALSNATVSLSTNGNEMQSKKLSDEQGKIYFELEKNKTYSITARKEGFMPDATTLNTNGITVSDTLEVTLHLDPLLVKGKTIKLENIHYDLDKDNIRPDAALILDGLEQVMRENPTLKIELSSHTDSRGRDAYNLALSQRRAQSAVNYLVSRGIARERMVAKGYGETKLINQCGNNSKCSEQEHQMNRRTEFTILSF